MHVIRLFILLWVALWPLGKLYAGEFIWAGKNNARWSDPSSWKTGHSNNFATQAPGKNDQVVFPSTTNARIILEADISIEKITVDKGAKLEFYAPKTINWLVSGDLNLQEKIKFKGEQNFHFATTENNAVIQTSGTRFTGDLLFEGKQPVQVTGDLQTQKNIVLYNQQLRTNASYLVANAFKLEGDKKNNSVFNGAKFILQDKQIRNAELLKDNSYEVLNGDMKAMGIGGGGLLNPCGTIPFLLTAVATSDYNGFDVSCNGSSDATICVNVTGGVGPFNYAWVGGPSTPCYSGVDAGNYIVVVFDMGQGGVSCFTTIVVNEPTEMTLLSWTGDNPSCFGVCDGTAVPVIVGGVPAYTYLWSTGETTPMAMQLCNGTNTVQVTDANGCIFDTTFFILIPTPVEPNLTATPTSCFGECDGIVASSPSGGNGAPYTFDWSTGSTNDSITGLCVGSYWVEVTDNNGCTGIDTIVVTQPPSMIVTVNTITHLVCNGVCSGSITITVSNGTPPYSLQWFDAATNLPVPGGTGTTISGLCAGSYYVVVNDNGSCQFQSSNITITQPPAVNITASAINLNCNGVCNGVLSAVVSGGTSPLSVTWFNAATGTSVGTGNPLGGRCAGNYFAQVTDGNGCIVLSTIVTITEPPALNISITQSNVLCAGSCSGSATATVSGGTGILNVTWHNSPSGTTIGSGTTINSLCSGNYYATVTDANGCTLNSAVFTVIEPPALAIDSQGNTDVTCNGACNGFAYFNVTGGVSPITVTWYQNPGAVPIGQTGDTAVGLCPGTYFAEAVDANGCTIQSANQVITQPPAINITINSTFSQCGTTCDGSASAVVSGGVPAYHFSWIDSTTNAVLPDTTNPISNLCAGTYYLVVTDDNGCRDTSMFFTIEATVIVGGSVTGTNITCNNFCNGLADLTPAGGFTPYTYVWFNQVTGLPIGQSSQDANGLCAGTYYVIVTDSTGCNSLPLPVTITEPPAITVNITPQNITCFGACNGQITSVVAGGVPGYTFNWINAVTGLPTGQTGATATGLCPGTYFLRVTDANGCIMNSTPVTITQPPAITASITTTPVSCFGVCNGTATVNISGGVSPYTVTWSTSGNTTGTETNLCAGVHTYSITDASGCTIGPFNFTITSPPNVTATVVNGSVACNGNCNGIVSVNVSGGNSPYSYSWDDPASQTTPVATGLCDGTYNVTVTDAAGCSYGPFSATVTEPMALSVTASSTNTSCAAGCSGTGTVNISGGTAPYSVLWNDPLSQTTTTAIQLCAGTYNVNVTDANGCTGTASITITSTTAPYVSITSSNTLCTSSCNGSATATVTGGTAPVNISWNTGATATTINSLCAGTYTVTVTDALGCTDVASVNITATSTPLTAATSSTLAACSVCNGSATVTPSGGSGSYNYQWSAAAGSQTTPTASALCAGNYTVVVTDAVTGCTGNFTVAVSNTGAEVINVDSTNALCADACNGTATVSFTCGDAPCSILWNDPAAQTTATATGLCAGTYGVTVTNASGCISAATIEVGEPEPIEVTATGTDILCNGGCTGQAVASATGGNGIYTYSWNDPASQTVFTAFNLCVGDFIVTVTDTSGCTGQDTVSIAEPPALNFTTAANNVSCAGQCNGSATVFPTGGNLPYTYQWDDAASQTTQMATGLCAGTYNVTVFDDNGCTSGPQSVNIVQPAAPLITISSTNPVCGGQCNGTATANVSGGTAPYSYLWNDPSAQTTVTATNLCPGNYQVTVTDGNGCVMGTASITITSVPALSVSVSPASVSCNGLCDGQLTSVITGGTAPYSVLWNDPSAQTNAIATALCPGAYTVIITDANGCTTSANQSVTEPAAINASLAVTDALCNGSCNGGATVTPTGGTGAISILWSPGGQTTTSVSGLCSGNYIVSLTDANGCNVQQNFAVNDPPLMTILTGTSPAECGVCNGSASISPIGGTPPYIYQWDAAAGNQTVQAALNLCAGIYQATVTDQNGCALSMNVPVSNIDGETLTVNTVPATCPDVCNGSATASTPCVNGPCNFAWFNAGTGASLGVTTSNISGLCPGEYIVRVINAVNCSTLVQFSIVSPDTIEVTETITQPLCSTSCTGAISVSATGGTGMLTFQWDAAAGGGTSNMVTGLCAGDYDLIVTDATGCDDTITYTIQTPLPLTVNVNSSSTFCSGTCTGVATAFVSGGTAAYTYLWNDPSAQTGSTASALCNGTYSVTVTDANGCTASSPAVNINQPAVLSAAVSSTPTLCSDDCDGSGTVVISGGTAPFNVQWNDPLNQTTSTASSLCPGSYDVTVTDANNCTDGPETIVVNAPGAVSGTFTVTDVSCNGLCSGAVTINATGGNGSYIYSLDNGMNFQSSATFTNLCAGSYQVVIRDGNNCESVTLSLNINEPTVLGANTASLNADCGLNNGAASVFPIGGTPAYTILWSDVLLNPIGQTTNTAINLGAGIYTATIHDNNGCEYQVSVTVSNNNAPTTTVVTTQPDCHGDCNGAIDVTVTSGVAPFTYEWYPNGQTTEDIVNVCAGTYVLQITDAPGCISFNTFTLAEPAAFTANVVTTDATCGQCNGTANATVTGGTGALSLVWSNLQTGSAATSLCGGSYSFMVTDANGCSEQFNTAVDNTGGPTPVVNVTNPVCASSCNGSATVAATGGTAPYAFLWVETGSTANTINNLCPGTYTVEVSDSLGCVSLSSVNVTSLPALSDSIVVVPASCGVCDGAIVAFAHGQPPFTFQWNAAAGSATTPSVSSLCLGLYQVVVTDGNGCSDTATAMLPNVNAPTATVTPTDVLCYGNCNGAATATGTGGNPPLNFNWFDPSLTSILNGPSSISSLCPGDYIVQVTDVLGCGSYMDFNIEEPDSLVASLNFVQDETCFNTCDGSMGAMPVNGTLPFTYSWTNPAGITTPIATNLCDGVYSVTVTDANGCALTLTDTIGEPVPIVVDLDSTDASCSTIADGAIDATVSGGAGGFVFSWTGPGGFTASTEDLSGIFYGTYILTVTDANGCSVTDTIVVNALLIAEADAGPDTVLCNYGNTNTLAGIGTPGATYTWTDTSGNVLSTTNVMTIPAGVNPGIFIFTVNNSGCIDSDTVNVTLNALPDVNAGVDQQIIAGQSVTIGGNPTTDIGNAVTWQPEGALSSTSSQNPSAKPVVTTEYVVQVTDGNGCIAYDTMVVTVFPDIIFPNGFSPNGDGANDTWILDFIEFFPDVEVSVFNRWGQPVFYSKGYNTPWDGTYEGKPVTIGTYYYVILLNHPLFPDAFTGPLTILR